MYLWQVPKYVWVLVVIAIAAFIICGTPFSADCVSMGGNREATRLAGVRVNGVVVGVYSLSGAFAGLAGVMLALGVAGLVHRRWVRRRRWIRSRR